MSQTLRSPAYLKAQELRRETALLGSVEHLLSWDQQVLMPPEGGAWRSEQLGLLSRMTHERLQDPKLRDLVYQAEHELASHDPLSTEFVNVRGWKREIELVSKIPVSLAQSLAETASEATSVWGQARQASDFSLFLPLLDRMISLIRDRARCVAINGNLYDGLLDEYEPGIRSADLTPMFAQLKSQLIPLVDRALGMPARAPMNILERAVSSSDQLRLAQLISSKMGLDPNHSRVDVTVHPFCTRVGPRDARITLRAEKVNWDDNFASTLHEAGHALYETGLDPAQYGQPMGQAASFGIHESQSRFWENFIGRTPEFAHYLVKHVFPQFDALKGFSPEDLYRGFTRVEKHPIRVVSDELTYNLHIIFRYEIEQAILSGDLMAKDLPEAWNSAISQSLGLKIDNDAHGVLQDMHWGGGLFGYFPSYALGNIYAAQLFDCASREIPDLKTAISEGEFKPLLNWLRDKIHRHGMRYKPVELIQHATGELPDPSILIRQLSAKYLDN